MEDIDDNCVELELFPFQGQVSGSHMVLEINKSLICKPHFDNEECFYANIPENLKEFTPIYHGTADVKFRQYEDTIRFLADIPSKFTKQFDSQEINVKPFYLPKNGSLLESHCISKNRWNPQQYSEKWSQRRIQKFIDKWTRNPTQKFTVLSNLLETYDFPCILDIKLGRRKRALYATEAKRQKKVGKCEKSTAAAISFTICGAKVYKSDTDTYISHGKEYCRALKVEDILEELRFFFNDGYEVLYAAIRCTISKLNSLYQVLLDQDTFYFFSSSLLLMYNNKSNNHGDNPDEKDTTEVTSCVDKNCAKEKSENVDIYMNGSGGCDYKADVRLIDFVHAVHRQEIDSSVESNDEEILEGIRNLITFLEKLL